MAHDRRAVQGLLPGRREPGRRLGQRQDAAARPGQPRLAGRPRPADDRDGDVLEGRPGDRDRRAASPRTSAPRSSSCRPPRTPRRTARSPRPSGCCSGATRRSSRRATPAASCGSTTTSAAIIREKLAGSTDERDRPLLDLTWDYPTRRSRRRAERRGGAARDQRHRRRTARPLSAYTELKDDGSTACGCWIYCGVYADGVNQARPPQARRRAGLGRRRVGLGLAGQPADPLQPRLGRPRRQAVERAQEVRLVGRRGNGKWTGHDVPGLHRRTGRPTTCPSPRARRARTRSAATTRSSCRPTARPGCSRRPGWPTVRCRPTTSRPSRRCANPLYGQQANPARQRARPRRQPDQPERAARSSPTCSRPTGSPSTTPPAA